VQQGQVIAGHFGDTANVVWFSAPITILTVVLGPIVSQAADYWGRKWFLVILTMFGAVGSVVVARATSMNMAIAGFSIIGIAYGTQPLLHVVTSEVLPRRWRGWAQAADMVSNGLGSICGLLVGGALNRTSDPTSDGFRYYYYMTMGWFVVAAVLCFFVYNPPPTPKQKELTTAEKLAKLDWIGYFLLAAGLVLFCVGLSWSQNPYPWSDPHVAATFAIGLAFALGLVVYETWFKTDGMFHHGLFTGNRNFAVAVFCVFSEGVAFFAANIYFAFQVSVLYETDALIVGTRYSIMLICSMIAAVLTGLYCAITRRVRWITVAAFLIFVVFFISMATTNRDTNLPVWGYPVLLGSALGMTLTTLVTVAQLSIPPELIAVASGLIISVRSLGGTVGITICKIYAPVCGQWR
jgi:MFS family permease